MREIKQIVEYQVYLSSLTSVFDHEAWTARVPVHHDLHVYHVILRLVNLALTLSHVTHIDHDSLLPFVNGHLHGAVSSSHPELLLSVHLPVQRNQVKGEEGQGHGLT